MAKSVPAAHELSRAAILAIVAFVAVELIRAHMASTQPTTAGTIS